ncbi:hypothetical protein [Motilimonas sp. KMU-193]|uniref:hypothetical protein n=1 Tax=Motilimonas sp. KMU-193 TaxID=3388668 RepID=UPI00396B4748
MSNILTSIALLLLSASCLAADTKVTKADIVGTWCYYEVVISGKPMESNDEYTFLENGEYSYKTPIGITGSDLWEIKDGFLLLGGPKKPKIISLVNDTLTLEAVVGTLKFRKSSCN